jgi:hypothetical protein
MAKSGERRMVFDTRGRRKHVIRVVYAILALLMGASLFLVVGPVSVGNLLGGGSSSSNAAAQFEEQAERLERKLAKSPEDTDLMTGLIRARINAGQQLVAVSSTGETALTVESVQQFQKASDAWSKYLKTTKEPAASTAQLMSPVLFALGETASSNAEIEANVKAAAQAQQIVADQRPTLNSVSTLAFYKLYAFDYAGAKKVGEEAAKLTNTKFERENLENQLEENEKRAREFQKGIAAANKLNQKAAKEGAVENPLSGASGGSPLSP